MFIDVIYKVEIIIKLFKKLKNNFNSVIGDKYAQCGFTRHLNDTNDEDEFKTINPFNLIHLIIFVYVKQSTVT